MQDNYRNICKIARTHAGMTQERWAEFAENPGAITTDAVIAAYSEAENVEKLQPQVDAFIAKQKNDKV